MAVSGVIGREAPAPPGNALLRPPGLRAARPRGAGLAAPPPLPVPDAPKRPYALRHLCNTFAPGQRALLSAYRRLAKEYR